MAKGTVAYPVDVESGELSFAGEEAVSTSECELLTNSTEGDQAFNDERERAALIVPYLARRNYHIPGNNLFQDWFQYVFANNHPIFGLCCHYKHHPVSNGTRMLVFFGTICASLAIFNIFYLYFLWKDGTIKQTAAFQTNITIIQGNEYLSLTSVAFADYQIALWTVGALIHSLYDMSIWTIAACAICAPGGALEHHADKRWFGKFVVFFIALLTAVIATLLVVLRASVDESSIQSINSVGIFDDAVDFEMVFNKSMYMYLRAWAIAFVLALFVYNAIISTILFSGILGCGGELPILGGRPYELKQEAKKRFKAKNKRRKSHRKSAPSIVLKDESERRSSKSTRVIAKDDMHKSQRRTSRDNRSSVKSTARDDERKSQRRVSGSNRSSVKSTAQGAGVPKAERRASRGNSSSVKSTAQDERKSQRRASRGNRSSVKSTIQYNALKSQRKPSRAEQSLLKSVIDDGDVRKSTKKTPRENRSSSKKIASKDDATALRSSKKVSKSTSTSGEREFFKDGISSGTGSTASATSSSASRSSSKAKKKKKRKSSKDDRKTAMLEDVSEEIN